MKLSGFTFVRNAIKLDYPVREAILSILPLVDEMIVAVGNSEDGTRELILSMGDPKIKIIDTVWDDQLREGGKVLAIETNKALDAIDPNSTWAIYIQADECLHEKDYTVIREALLQYAEHPKVEGLLFKYLHFYGSYDYVGDSRTWYRNEIRIIRNLIGVRSYRDAQGFRLNGRKLRVKAIDACVHHYGWVRPPDKMMAKSLEANRYWHDDQWIQQRFDPSKDFDYSQIDSLALFKGTHPFVMKERIQSKNWKFTHDPSIKKFGFKQKLLYFLEQISGWRPGEYRNYKKV